MSDSEAGTDGLRSRLERELDRIQVRARNGIRHISGQATGDIAVTPKDQVWKRDGVTLYRYRSEQRSGAAPILLVMSLVTKSYVFDLRPGSSLVEDFLAAGRDVFLLDWGVPQPVDSFNGIDRYVDEYIPRAVRATLNESGAEDVTLFGYCLGALLALISKAGNPDLPVRSMVLLATPVDLQQLGPMASLVGDERLELSRLLDETGNVPGSVIKESFRLVQPTAALTTYSNLWQSLAKEEALEAHNALIGWSNDHIPFPGTAFVEFARDYFRGGAPLQGVAPIAGRDAELSSITCPVVSVYGSRDKLVPPSASAPLAGLLTNADFDEIELPAGHAGLFVGRQARTRCVPEILAWIDKHN